MNKISKENALRFKKLRFMGCVVCRLYDPIMNSPNNKREIHHEISPEENNNERGAGMKSPDHRTICLCTMHHTQGGHGVALHAGVKTWEEKYNTQDELIRISNELMEEEFFESL